MSSIQRIERQSGVRYKAVLKQGAQVLKTKTFTKRKHASDWLKRMSADQELIAALGMRGAQLAFRELAELYLAQWDGRDTGRPGQVRRWAEWLGEMRLTAITTDCIREHLKAFSAGNAQRPCGSRSNKTLTDINRPRKPATVNRMRAALSAVFKFAIAEGLIKTNPVTGIAQRPERNARQRYLSEEEVKRLLSAAKACSWSRMYLLILMAITTGARKSELLHLKWEHIDFDRRLALLSQTKNGDQRYLPLTEDVIKLLRQCRGIGLVFPSALKPWQPFEIKKVWFDTLRHANFPTDTSHPHYFRFHDLRHTAGSFLVMNGATLYETGEILGHRNVQTTKRYAHLSTQHKQQVTDRIFGGLNTHAEN